MNRPLLLALTLATLPLFAAAPDLTLIHAPDGAIQGTPSPDGAVLSYKGIPYAAPPVGDLRWKAPQPVKPWDGVLKASEFGARCMQGHDFGDMVFRDNGPSEDCLYLNVWRPASAGAAKLPVMVWIYGGGFTGGAASEPRQDGTNLAKKGVIVVSMNYRLGIFGFFAHPELTKESEHHASGNYGLMDQTAALQWVHKNIALFGGDPKNVTIFGESAGSFSVCAQMASPLAHGLFEKAIGESGAFFGRSLKAVSLAESEAAGAKFAESELGATSLEALRAKPADALLTAQAKPGVTRFSANIDGYFMPEDINTIYSEGKQSHVPLLAGWNSDEGSFHMFFQKDDASAANYAAHAKTTYGDNAAQFLKLYPGETDVQAKRSAQDWSGDQFIAYSTWKWLELQAKTGGHPVFRYEFDEAPPGQDRGAYHSAEIEFVFGALASKDYKWTDEDQKLSDIMSTYWSNFAKTGNPNGAGLPSWPVYKKSDEYAVMHLTTSPHAEPDSHRARYLFLESVKPVQP